MTEEEAKTKWCPHVRVTTLDEKIASNRGRYVRDDIDTNCIGSACMMWRQIDLSRVPMDELHKYSKGDGYCGLAGKS